jgi:hypothetical protein
MSFHRHLTVITETQEDLTIIKTYKTTIRPSNQTRKGDIHECSRENHIYMLLAE